MYIFPCFVEKKIRKSNLAHHVQLSQTWEICIPRQAKWRWLTSSMEISPLRLPADATNKAQIICLQHVLNLWNEWKTSRHKQRRNSGESGRDKWVNSPPRVFVLIRQSKYFASVRDISHLPLYQMRCFLWSQLVTPDNILFPGYHHFLWKSQKNVDCREVKNYNEM